MTWLTGGRGLPGVLITLAVGAGLLLLAGSRPFGWVALAGVAGVVATSSTLRRLVGALLVVVAVAAVLAVLAGADISDGSDVRWPWLAVAGGVVVAVSGAVVAVSGGQWTGLSRRYDPGAASAQTEPIDVWRALDRGEDPTDTDTDPDLDTDPADDAPSTSGLDQRGDR